MTEVALLSGYLAVLVGALFVVALCFAFLVFLAVMLWREGRLYDRADRARGL